MGGGSLEGRGLPVTLLAHQMPTFSPLPNPTDPASLPGKIIAFSRGDGLLSTQRWQRRKESLKLACSPGSRLPKWKDGNELFKDTGATFAKTESLLSAPETLWQMSGSLSSSQIALVPSPTQRSALPQRQFRLALTNRPPFLSGQKVSIR
jgi:hypothetical protein